MTITIGDWRDFQHIPADCTCHWTQGTRWLSWHTPPGIWRLDHIDPACPRHAATP